MGLVLALLLSLISQAGAQQFVALPAAPTGKALLNVFEISAFPYMNFLLGAGGCGYVPGGVQLVSTLDANNFPNVGGALSAAVGCQVLLPPTSEYSGQYVLDWIGTNGSVGNTGFQISRGTTIVSGGAFVSGSTAVNTNTFGTNGSITFTFNAAITTNNVTISFPAGAAYSLARLRLYKVADQAALNAGKIFNPDFIADLKALNPKTLRFVDASGIDGSGNISQSSLGTPVTAFSYSQPRWDPTVWAGTASGTDTYAATLAGATLTDGQTIQAQFTNANTVTAPTLNVNGLGAVVVKDMSAAALGGGNITSLGAIVGGSGYVNGTYTGVTLTGGNGTGAKANITVSGGAVTLVDIPAIAGDGTSRGNQYKIGDVLSASNSNLGGSGSGFTVTVSAITGSISANSISTLIYDSVLNNWLIYPNHGIGAFTPLAVIVQLCNEVNASLWHNIPTHYTDASVTADGRYIKTNLGINLTDYEEYSNEIWNNFFGFEQTAWAIARGQALGFPAANGEDYMGFYGLRFRQVMGNLTTVWNGQGNLRRVLAFAEALDTAATNKYRLQGFDLCGTSCGNATYQSLVGANYNTAPNRPVDFADGLSYATYYSGGVLTNGVYGGPSAYGPGPSTCSALGDLAALTGAADNYATGTPTSIAAAFAWVDCDLRQGQRNGVLVSQTLLAKLTNKYPGWTAIANSYSIPIYNYEGGDESLAPTPAQCTTAGISTSYGGAGGLIDNMLVGYKNSASFSTLVLNQLQQLAGASPANSVPAYYHLTGPNTGDQWSMFPGDLYSTPFKSYDGVSSYNH